MSLLLLSSGFISFSSSVPTLNLGSGAVHAAFLKWKMFSLQLVARFLVVIKASYFCINIWARFELWSQFIDSVLFY